MPRYIDADALLESLKNFTYSEPCTEFQRGVNAVVPLILSEIKYFHTADVSQRAEVAREIFEEIEKYVEVALMNGHIETPILCIGYSTFVELKKKYTEDVK